MIYFDEDCDWRLQGPSAEAALRELDKIVMQMHENQIGALIIGVNAQRVNYSGSSCWESYTGTFLPGNTGCRSVLNLMELEQRGIDTNRYLLKAAAEYGISGWLGIRMNDMHGGENRSYPFHSNFWRDNPQFWISNTPYENGFDFSHFEVRRRFLDLVVELLERYEFRGLLLDFLRFPMFFRQGEGWKKRELMTSLVKEIHDAVKRKNPDMTLAVRVPMKIENCERLGLDVLNWSRCGIADRFFLGMFIMTQTFDPPLEEWREKVTQPVTVSLDDSYRSCPEKPWRAGTVEELRGAAFAALSRGSDGIFLFNHMALRNDPVRHDKLAGLDDMNFLRGRRRTVGPGWDDMDLTIAEQDAISRLGMPSHRRFPLPLTLFPGGSADLIFRTGFLETEQLHAKVEVESPAERKENEFISGNGEPGLEIILTPENDSCRMTLRNRSPVPCRILDAAVEIIPEEIHSNTNISSRKIQQRKESIMKNHVFTLVELLVVIAIIAILASLLLPALNRAAMSARTAKCQGNAKQMFLVQLNYIDNYRDCILPSSMFGKCWGLVLHEQKLLPGSTNVYGDGCGIIRCPEEKTLKIDLQLVNNYHYGLNSNVSPPYASTYTDVKCFRYGRMKNPSSISFMMDSTGKNNMQFNALTNIARRHLLAANVLYLDGHVIKERLITGSSSSPFWSYGLQP